MMTRLNLAAATVACTCVFLTLGTPAWAGQESLRGTIEGRVVQRGTDRVVPGAIVRLQPIGTVTVSDEKGEFAIASVPAGRYSLTCEADGYVPGSLADVEVVDGGTARVTVDLDPDPLRIDERVDVVGQLPRQSESQPGSAFTLTGTQLTTISGTMGDFGRTLRSVPAAAGTSDERNAIVARGGNPIENTFYVDNMEVPNISHMPDWGSTGGYYSLIDPSAVSAFDFIVNGFPAKFGGSLSSVTDIAYREGSRDRVKGHARFDIAMAAAAAEGPLPGKRGSWRASVRHADFIYLKEILSLNDANPRWTDAHLKAVYDLSPRHSVSLVDLYSSDRLRDPQDGFPASWDIIDQNTVGLNWRASWSSRVRSETSISYSEFGRDLAHEYAPPEDAYDWGIRHTTDWYALRNENTLSVGSAGLVQFGAQVRRFSHEVRYLTIPVRPGTILFSTGPWHYRTTEAAGFVSGTVRPFSRLGVTGGLRVEHSTAGGRTHLSPRVSASFRLAGGWSLNGAAAIVYQPLPADFLAVDHTFWRLRDMRADQYSVGAGFTGGSWRATVEAYYKDYSALPFDPAYPHRPILDREPFRDYHIPLDLVDTGSGRARGVEALVERRVGRRFSAVVAARVARNTYTDTLGVERNRLYDSRYGLSVAADWMPDPRWSISTTFVMQDGTPYTPTHEEASIAWGIWVRRGSLYNTLRYPTYASLNARVERRFPVGPTTLAVFFDCWNVLGRKNIGWIEGWNPVEGDVFKNQMPRTPFVGVGIIF
ncbi:MAG: TonB-dependent receptor [Acidobacteriota bacterium]